MRYSCEKSILRENPVLPIKKFSPLALFGNRITLQHLIIQISFNYLFPGARFSKLPVITVPVKLFCFPLQMTVSKGLKIVQ